MSDPNFEAIKYAWKSPRIIILAILGIVAALLGGSGLGIYIDCNQSHGVAVDIDDEMADACENSWVAFIYIAFMLYASFRVNYLVHQRKKEYFTKRGFSV